MFLHTCPFSLDTYIKILWNYQNLIKEKENVKLKRCLSQSKAIFYITPFFGLLLSQFI